MMKKLIYAAMLLMVTILACSRKDFLGEAPRLFRPVSVSDGLESGGNWIQATWQSIKGASSYTVAISRDTFQTIDATMTIENDTAVFTDLLWETLYQVRVRANHADTVKNSKWGELGAIKTARFPTILNVPASSEISEVAVKVSWTTGGAAVTGIKILLAADSSVVRDVALTATDVSNEYRIVTGLTASTPYIIFLYSDATVRGWANFTTKEALAGDLIDLREISGRPSVLADTIPVVPSGSTIILKRGETYEISSTLYLDKSLAFVAGSDLLVPDKPVIYMPANFNIVSGSNIQFITFKEIILRGSSYSSKYVFNINQACTIGTLRYESCTMEIFRGVTRTQSQPAIIDNFEIDNCIIDSIAGYGVLTIDVTSSKADKISITNSTIYKAEKIVTSRNNSTSLIIDNCTINEAPRGGNYYIDYSISTSNEVTMPISFKNNILGIGKDNSGNTAVRGYRIGAGSTIDVSNTYTTSEHVFTSNPLPNVIAYGKSSTELWTDPANGDFHFLDNSFPGKNTAGDPRWRP